MSIFSKRLKLCREKKKEENSSWTQEYAANKIGVARTTYTAYENGTKSPPIETINQMADLFGVSADYLLGRTDNSSPSHMNKDEEEFQVFANDPSLQKWYKELPKTKEEDLRKLRKMWEILKDNGEL